MTSEHVIRFLEEVIGYNALYAIVQRGKSLPNIEAYCLAWQIKGKLLLNKGRANLPFNINSKQGRVTHPMIIHPLSIRGRSVSFPDGERNLELGRGGFKTVDGGSYGIYSTIFFNKWNKNSIWAYMEYAKANYIGGSLVNCASDAKHFDFALSREDIYFSVSGQLSSGCARQTLVLFNAERSLVEKLNNSVRRLAGQSAVRLPEESL